MDANSSPANEQIETAITPARNDLIAHPLLAERGVRTIEDLRAFMESHIYAVWDFMSLTKALQGALAPVTVPWIPPQTDPAVVRMINEIVLIEESDQGMTPGTTCSHTDLYLQSMDEVGADSATFRTFLDRVIRNGVRTALDETPGIPDHARTFVATTFDVIEGGAIHDIAAAFTFGRETVIPPMFKTFIDHCGIGPDAAPVFHYYLDRHIEVDEGEHGPAARKMLDTLCDNQAPRIQSAIQAAEKAVRDRIAFWDGLAASLDA